jgi:outer membrane receptor for ferrienterochelin and colicins
VTNSNKRVIDAFAAWQLNRDTQLRLSASNLAPLDYANSSLTLTPDKRISSESSGRSFTNWQLRMEIKV